jgi:hypothetical protein
MCVSSKQGRKVHHSQTCYGLTATELNNCMNYSLPMVIRNGISGSVASKHPYRRQSSWSAEVLLGENEKRQVHLPTWVAHSRAAEQLRPDCCGGLYLSVSLLKTLFLVSRQSWALAHQSTAVHGEISWSLPRTVTRASRVRTPASSNSFSFSTLPTQDADPLMA